MPKIFMTLVSLIVATSLHAITVSEGFSDLYTEEKSSSATPCVTLKSEMQSGEKIKLTLKYSGEINISGVEGTPESAKEQEYTLTGQTVVIQGNVTELYCAENKISELTFEQCELLSVLDCSDNQIKRLNLSEAPKLEILICSKNLLESLDLTQIPEATKVWCSDNPSITSLDLSKSENLLGLWCYKCSLSTLDLSACPYLSGVDCSNNALKTLTLGQSDYMTRISCGNNQLEAIDLSGVPNLDELLCENNNLAGLTLNSVAYLSSLKCYNNNLSTLDLSALQYLKDLYCQGNQLKDLDLSANKSLETIYCYENQIEGDKMTSLVLSLHQVSPGDYENLMIINSSNPKERNHPMVTDIAKAIEKGWMPKDYQNGVNNGEGVPFDGFNGVNQISKGSNLSIALLSDKTLIVTSGMPEPLSLYTMDGVLIHEDVVSSTPFRLSLEDYSGILILCVGSITQQIVIP